MPTSRVDNQTSAALIWGSIGITVLVLAVACLIGFRLLFQEDKPRDRPVAGAPKAFFGQKDKDFQKDKGFRGNPGGPGPGDVGIPVDPPPVLVEPEGPGRAPLRFLDLPDLPKPAAIKPPVLEKEQVVRELPSAVSAVAVGGGGRYLILQLPKVRKLAVFDANEGKVNHFVSDVDGNVLFTAGMDKLLLTRGGALERWSLTTFEREATVPLPAAREVRGLGLGSASNGPLFVILAGENGFADQGWFLSVDTLKPLAIKEGEKEFINLAAGPTIQVSADGKVFGLARHDRRHIFSESTETLALSGKDLAHYREGTTLDLNAPLGDKEFYLGRDSYRNQVKGRHRIAFLDFKTNQQHDVCTVPARQGDYYLTLDLADNDKTVEVRRVGVPEPLVRLPNLDPSMRLPEWGGGGGLLLGVGLSYAQRLHLIPAAKLLVLIPTDDDKLILQRVDPEAALTKKGDFLVVESQPPPSVARGEAYSYQINARSDKGGIRYRLESGPEGAKLAANGLLTWTVPADLPETASNVVVSAHDDGGREVFQNFWITHPGDAGPPRPTPAAPPPPKPVVLKPPALNKDRVEVPLGGTVAGVAVGGGGRFLVLHLRDKRKLAIFDVNEAKVVHTISLAEDNVLFAAGMDRLLVVQAGTNLAERWSLTTFQREKVLGLPPWTVIKALEMGCASNGPLLVHFADGMAELDRAGFAFLDLETLRPLPAKWVGGSPHNGSFRDQVQLRASPDGRVFGLWATSHTPQGLETFIRVGEEVQVFYQHDDFGHVVPGAEGELVFTGVGLFTPQLQSREGNAPGRIAPRFCLPAPREPYYLTIHPTPGFRQPAKDSWASVWRVGEDKPLVEKVPNFDPGLDPEPPHRDEGTYDRRIHFLPEAKVIITIPHPRDRLVLQRFDVGAAGKK